MIRNYFKIAWRNMMKNKFFSFVNIFGLAVGLACCMLIALYLSYETSYDSYHKNINDLYQIGTVLIKTGEKNDKWSSTPAPMGPALKREFPEIMETTRLLPLFVDDKTTIQYNIANSEKRSFLEDGGYLADPSYFNMFTYNFIEGQPKNALAAPFSVVISEDIAHKIFGGQPALHKVIHINSNTNGEHDYTVTGIFKPMVQPSHIDGRFFMGFAGGQVDQYMKTRWTDLARNNMFYTYLQLRPGTSAAELQGKFPAFIHRYADADLKKMGFYKEQFLLPVKDIHLDSELPNNVTPPDSKTYLYILGSIALFTLLIACINFMNLSTARSSKRSSEVGVRKVLGAEKGTLVRQFLGESLLMTFMAFILAIFFTLLVLPLFNTVSGRNIQLSFAADGKLLAGFLLMAIITGFLAGSYPAFYLSSFNPVKVLKGKLSNSFAVAFVRKGLVVFQFVISIVLIIASVVIARQMHYLRSADLGFAKDEQIVVPLRTQEAKRAYATLKGELKNSSYILSVGASLYYPGISNPSDDMYYRAGQSMGEAKDTKMNWVDFDFLNTLGIKPVAGRIFSGQFRADTGNSLVLNLSAIKRLGFKSPQEAVGCKLYFNIDSKQYDFNIVGVVNDFHYEDLHLAVKPFGFQVMTEQSDFNYMIIHAKTANMGALLENIGTTWKKYDRNDPFDYTFLDQQFQKNYDADNRLAAIVGYFTLIAIIISCLGLFGLAAFSAEQRTKEIGVRKVLGASVATIVSLLSIDFLKLIILSIVIASPLAWYIMGKWLQTFEYRRPMSWEIFVYTTLIGIIIGLVTIIFQAIKAAIANPVKSLRSE